MQLQKEKKLCISIRKIDARVLGMGNEDRVVTHWHVKPGIIIRVGSCRGQRDGNGALNLGQSNQEESHLDPMGMWAASLGQELW